MKEILIKFFNDTYKQTLDDNEEDFIKIFTIINKLCVILVSKNIISEEELTEILKIDKNIIDLENKGGQNENNN